MFINRYLHTHHLQQGNRRRNVLEVRHVAHGHRFGCEQRAGEYRQSRVLGAGYGNLARQASATLNK